MRPVGATHAAAPGCRLVTPSELGAELGVDAKPLRAWLRRTWPREAAEHGTRHELSPGQVAAARQRSGTGGSVAAPSLRRAAPGTRAALERSTGRGGSDEDYVLDLIDTILSLPGLRQHRFPWLLGDPGVSGFRVALPVDGYWPDHKLVVEYRERQHDEATPFFDKPDRLTVSGVHRGEQRRIYDARRDQLIPEHGLRLLVVKPSDLSADGRGRLLRLTQDDLRALRRLLDDCGPAS
jgi:hypothetical protein